MVKYLINNKKGVVLIITKEDFNCINDKYTKIATVHNWFSERTNGDLLFIMLRYRRKGVVMVLRNENDHFSLVYSTHVVYTKEFDINNIKNKVNEIKCLIRGKLFYKTEFRVRLLTNDISVVSINKY